jgi:hypothetical protein
VPEWNPGNRVLPASRDRILESVGPDDLVLDVGGWAAPFPRADWVIDLLPYETRGLYGGKPDPAEERFRAETWVQRDICAREPWPFGDDQFDFAICSQTLEDVRDPIFACSELVRVARSGYIEVPSRVEEQTYGIQGPWVGWGHHHWLIDRTPDGLEFVFKHHIVHGKESHRFPAGYCDELSSEERAETLWWRDRFSFGERIIVDPGELDAYLTELVATRMGSKRRRTPSRWRRRR